MDDEIRACKKETNFDTARQDTSQTFTWRFTASATSAHIWADWRNWNSVYFSH